MSFIRDRALSRRSHLTFEFPEKDGRHRKVYIPFLQNIEISESQRSSLGEYNLLSRSGSLFSYAGAKSRSFNLRFMMTLPHIVSEIHSGKGLGEYFYSRFKEFSNESDEFAFYQSANSSAGNLDKFKVKSEQARAHREYYTSIVGRIPTTNSTIPNTRNTGGKLRVSDILEIDKEEKLLDSYTEINKIIDLYLFWINIIRCSTINNSMLTSLGPPIIRVTHGPMYNNIPCVAASYDIEISQDLGYDVETLCPNQVVIRLNLNEVRVGNYGKYTIGNITSGDNLPGWESVLNNDTMDPYNGLIRLG